MANDNNDDVNDALKPKTTHIGNQNEKKHIMVLTLRKWDRDAQNMVVKRRKGKNPERTEVSKDRQRSFDYVGSYLWRTKSFSIYVI